MEQYTGTPLQLQNFEVDKVWDGRVKGVKTFVLKGHLTNEVHKERCPFCGYRRMHSNGRRTTRLKHLSVGGFQIQVEVKYTRWECQVCHACFRSHIPFKAKGHRATKLFLKQVLAKVSGGETVGRCAHELHVNRNLVKEVDGRRLESLAGDMKPKRYSPYISVDEFLLHKGHRYATIVVDYCSGESLFATQGRTHGQMLEFFRFVGDDFMKHVVAVSMDMNASYAKAFKELYPHIKVVYDGFHIVKNYNDMVLTGIRRAEQRRLMEAMSRAKADHDRGLYRELKDEYRLFKGSRYLVLSNRRTLELKDRACAEHNRALFERYEMKGLKVPIGKRYLSTRNIERLGDVLSANERLQTAYNLGEMLKSALKCRDLRAFDEDMPKWLSMAKAAGCEELDRFCRLLENHWDGIRNRVLFNMSNGPLEGTNCLIKNIRRQSYGIRDDRYFFLKIWEATRRHPKHRLVS